MDIAALFEEQPRQYGMRGDVYLWQELREALRDVPLPDSAEGLEQTLRTQFQNLSGSALETVEPFFVERYNHGGMSGGYVHPKWWREKLIPLLKQRYLDCAES